MGNKLRYYNYDKIFSFNAVYNFICGPRGNGKTYGAKYKAIKRSVERGEMFIYLRRFKSELTGKDTFFTDIQHEFPQWEFRVHGKTAQCRAVGSKEKDAWRDIGYFIALSQAQTQKSRAFPSVTMIIFDEFIIDKGALRYLPDEAKLFNDFFSTVDRWQDKTRVFFLANTVNMSNPYFLEFGIKPDQMPEYSIMYDGFMSVHFPESKEFEADVYRTRFGKFIQNTEYADFAVGGEFKDNSDALVAQKPANAKYLMTLHTRTGVFSVWSHHNGGAYYYLQERRPKGRERHVTNEPRLMDDDMLLLTYQDGPLNMLRAAFRNGRAYFDQPQTRNAFVEIFRR